MGRDTAYDSLDSSDRAGMIEDMMRNMNINDLMYVQFAVRDAIVKRRKEVLAIRKRNLARRAKQARLVDELSSEEETEDEAVAGIDG